MLLSQALTGKQDVPVHHFENYLFPTGAISKSFFLLTWPKPQCAWKTGQSNVKVLVQLINENVAKCELHFLCEITFWLTVPQISK